MRRNGIRRLQRIDEATKGRNVTSASMWPVDAERNLGGLREHDYETIWTVATDLVR